MSNLKCLTKDQEEIVHRIYHGPQCLSYVSDKEYRDCVRNIFKFTPGKLTSLADQKVTEEELKEVYDELDELTKDEIEFDSPAIKTGLNAVYELTEDDPDFYELYTISAFKMMSMDPTVGQCVLCSYDNFANYYIALRNYFAKHYADDFDEEFCDSKKDGGKALSLLLYRFQLKEEKK